MAENKKSFVLYADLINLVEKLDDQKAGHLFKHILRYVNDYDPETDDLIVQVAFEPIKLQLKRDLKRWEEIRLKRSEAGKQGGRGNTKSKPKQNKTNKANAFFEKQTKAKKGVNVNVNVNDNVINKKDIHIYKSFDHLKISEEEVQKLMDLGYTKEQIDSILESIENYGKNKNYKSLYLTSKKWLEREFPNAQPKTKQDNYERKKKESTQFR